MSTPKHNFYVIGGTLTSNAACYVERHADIEVYQGLKNSEFCYVLTSRQMGKSSLMVRAVARLREEGTAIVVLDLTAIGQNLTAEQWYNGLLGRIARQFDLEDHLDNYWQAHTQLSPLQRLMTAIREVVLPRCPDRLVIFVDEIDTVRSLPFATGEFFASMRECYNRRSEDPDFQRLTFCLLGVATPADLIRDPHMTPFNIGRRIELNDFTTVEALPLAKGLGRPEKIAVTLLQRIYFWTGGHPYLTQRLCQAVAQDAKVVDPEAVDRLCEELFLSPRAQERDDNLIFVREQLLRDKTDLASVLQLYGQVHNGKRVPDDPTNPLISRLRLSGITRVSEETLQVRNQIYNRVFDQEWVETQQPHAELNRQRTAYRRSLLRLTAEVVSILAVVVCLVLFASSQSRRAQEWEGKARQYQYLADMHLASQAFEAGNFQHAMFLLRGHRPISGQEDRRGFEWRCLWRLCRKQKAEALSGYQGNASLLTFSLNGKYLATVSDDNTATLWDFPARRAIGTLTGHTNRIAAAAFSPDSKLVATGSTDGKIRLWNAGTSKEAGRLQLPVASIRSIAFSSDGKTLIVGDGDHNVQLWNVDAQQQMAVLKGHQGGVTSVMLAPDGTVLATASEDSTVKLWDVSARSELATLKGHRGHVRSLAFSPDGKILATAGDDKTVRLWDSANYREIISLSGHGDAVIGVVFSRDGKTLISAGLDKAIRFWSVPLLREIVSFKQLAQPVVSLAFAPDGSALVFASAESAVTVWGADSLADADAQDNPIPTR